MNILIVDDDAIARLIMQQHLKLGQFGADVTSVENGNEALNLLLEGHKPDVILLDINMPIMNGFELLENMKRHNISKDVYMITSSNLTEDREQAQKYDFVKGFFQKPFGSDHVSILKETA